jgi:hypothetical protein
VKQSWHRSCRAHFLALAFACGTAPAEPGVSTLAVPPPDDFAPLSTALARSCGSLDCHGREAQNLRLYGEIGLRLDPTDIPGGDETTPLEHQANHDSVVLLEPELLSSVWLQAGRAAARLTLVRKARGQEAHKGGAVFPEGGDGDQCLLSWLAGNVDMEACARAAELPRSPFEPFEP